MLKKLIKNLRRLWRKFRQRIEEEVGHQFTYQLLIVLTEMICVIFYFGKKCLVGIDSILVQREYFPLYLLRFKKILRFRNFFSINQIFVYIIYQKRSWNVCNLNLLLKNGYHLDHEKKHLVRLHGSI